MVTAFMLTAFSCSDFSDDETPSGTDATTTQSSGTTADGTTASTTTGGGGTQPPSGGNEDNVLDLKVMSFNIRYYNDSDNNNPLRAWDSRKQAVSDFIKNSGAGVVCMQEVKPEQRTYLQTALSDKYGLIWYGRDALEDTAGEGLAIAYDKGVWTLEEQGRFWLSETPDTPSKGWGASIRRICVTAKLKHSSTGAVLEVFNVHLDHAVEAARTNGMNLVLDKVKKAENPVYLCGDFNCYSTDDAYKNTAAVMLDSQVASKQTDSGVTYHNWGAITEGTPIDFNFFSKNDFEALTFDICTDKWGENNDKYYSDHYAIISTVKMKYKIVETPSIGGGMQGSNGEGDHTQNY